MVLTLLPVLQDHPVRSGRTLHSSPSMHGCIWHHHFWATMEAEGNSTTEARSLLAMHKIGLIVLNSAQSTMLAWNRSTDGSFWGFFYSVNVIGSVHGADRSARAPQTVCSNLHYLWAAMSFFFFSNCNIITVISTGLKYIAVSLFNQINVIPSHGILKSAQNGRVWHQPDKRNKIKSTEEQRYDVLPTGTSEYNQSCGHPEGFWASLWLTRYNLDE